MQSEWQKRAYKRLMRKPRQQLVKSLITYIIWLVAIVIFILAASETPDSIGWMELFK